MDWKDQLAALQPLLPEGSPENENETAISSPEKPDPTKKPTVNVIYERKGRAGKSATILEGFGQIPEERLLALAALLKSRLGIGGSARGGEILLQGDQRSERLKAILESEGFKVKGCL